MKQNINRGDVYIVEFGKTIGSVQGGMRPVVVIQNNIGNKHSSTLIVATITSKVNKKRTLPTHIRFVNEFLDKESVVQLEQITTIDKQQLLDYAGQVPLSVMEEINEAIKVSLNIK